MRKYWKRSKAIRCSLAVKQLMNSAIACHRGRGSGDEIESRMPRPPVFGVQQNFKEVLITRKV